jgi:hypothetical protein
LEKIMTIKLSTGLVNAMMGTVGFKGAFANGVIELRSGNQPATADSAATGTLLGIITLNGGAFTAGVATNGLNFDAPVDGKVTKPLLDAWSYTGLANGTIGHARVKQNGVDDGSASTTASRMDLSCGASGADMIMDTAVLIATPAAVDKFEFTLPKQ